MIRALTEADRTMILDFAYGRERENLFVIGSLARPDPFGKNRYFGAFRRGELIGIAAWFGQWRSFVAQSLDLPALWSLTDRAAEEGFAIETVPAFRHYAVAVLERLRSHGMTPKTVSEQQVFVLGRDGFHPHEGEAERAREEDREALARADCGWVRPDGSAVTVRDIDRERVIPDDTFVCREDGRIVSKATVHGISRHYAQIGGVTTHPDFRSRGFAKRCVSALCAHCFAGGVDHVLLFTANDNVAARKVYHALGFVLGDDYVIVSYV